MPASPRSKSWPPCRGIAGPSNSDYTSAPITPKYTHIRTHTMLLHAKLNLRPQHRSINKPKLINLCSVPSKRPNHSPIVWRNSSMTISSQCPSLEIPTTTRRRIHIKDPRPLVSPSPTDLDRRNSLIRIKRDRVRFSSRAAVRDGLPTGETKRDAV